MQFLRENNLIQSLSALEKESNLYLNTVENKQKFLQDILDGRWDIILKQAQHLGLDKLDLFDLYEQVASVVYTHIQHFLIILFFHQGDIRINRG